MSKKVKAKKSFGQHFLKDHDITMRIAESLTGHNNYEEVLEVGPGMGMLTQYLLKNDSYQLHAIEVDRDSVTYLHAHYPELSPRLYSQDFIKVDAAELMGNKPFALIGNYPYNISSQIMFKVLDFKDLIPEVSGMFQKEVARRIASPPGSREYGILSVLLQAWYDIEYLFDVPQHVFDPPPKVMSGVIRLRRNDVTDLGVPESEFKKMIKLGFSARRKTLRNALKSHAKYENFLMHPFMDKRAEQLSVADFIELTKLALGE